MASPRQAPAARPGSSPAAAELLLPSQPAVLPPLDDFKAGSSEAEKRRQMILGVAAKRPERSGVRVRPLVARADEALGGGEDGTARETAVISSKTGATDDPFAKAPAKSPVPSVSSSSRSSVQPVSSAAPYYALPAGDVQSRRRDQSAEVRPSASRLAPPPTIPRLYSDTLPSAAQRPLDLPPVVLPTLRTTLVVPEKIEQLLKQCREQWHGMLSWEKQGVDDYVSKILLSTPLGDAVADRSIASLAASPNQVIAFARACIHVDMHVLQSDFFSDVLGPFFLLRGSSLPVVDATSSPASHLDLHLPVHPSPFLLDKVSDNEMRLVLYKKNLKAGGNTIIEVFYRCVLLKKTADEVVFFFEDFDEHTLKGEAAALLEDRRKVVMRNYSNLVTGCESGCVVLVS